MVENKASMPEQGALQEVLEVDCPVDNVACAPMAGLKYSSKRVNKNRK